MKLSGQSTSQESILLQDIPNVRPNSVAIRSGTLEYPRTSRTRSDNAFSTTHVDVLIPAVEVFLTKEVLDGCQYWADDMAQWAEHAFSGKTSKDASTASSSRATSRKQSTIIGSRYFFERTASQMGDEEESVPSQVTVALKVDDGR